MKSMHIYLDEQCHSIVSFAYEPRKGKTDASDNDECAM